MYDWILEFIEMTGCSWSEAVAEYELINGRE